MREGLQGEAGGGVAPRCDRLPPIQEEEGKRRRGVPRLSVSPENKWLQASSGAQEAQTLGFWVVALRWAGDWLSGQGARSQTQLQRTLSLIVQCSEDLFILGRV